MPYKKACFTRTPTILLYFIENATVLHADIKIATD